MRFYQREDAHLVAKIIGEYFYRRVMRDQEIMLFHFLLQVTDREKHHLVGAVNNGDA